MPVRAFPAARANITAAVAAVQMIPGTECRGWYPVASTSRALQGDGALSGIGAVTSLFALAALALYRTLGWWWADPAAALAVAAIAAAEAWHTAPRAHPHL